MDNYNENEINIDIGLILVKLCKFKTIRNIIILGAACGICAFFFSKFCIPEQFTSQVYMYVNNNAVVTTGGKVEINDINASQKIVESCIVILKDNVVMEEIGNMLLKNYDVNEIANKIIPYYTLETIEGNTTGILTEDIVINVYYTRNQNTLTINYLEKESGVKLADSVVQTYAQGSEYDVSTDTQKEIEHYTIDNISGEPEGVITEDIIIDVYYSHNIGKVIVNYIDTKGNELAESIIISGNVFDEYKTEPKEIDGYALYSTPENKEGTIQEETIIVTYVYDKQQEPVVSEPDNPPVKSPDTGADSYGPFKLIEFFSAIMLFFSGIILVAFFKPRNTDKKE